MADRKRSFEEAAARSERAIWALLAGATGNDETARDLAQETFLRAWRAWGRFRGDASAFTWFYAIARNVLRRHARRERFRRALLERFAREPRDPAPPDAHDASSLRLRRAVASLAEPFRETVLLHYFADRSVKEIAVDLGVAEGTVKSRLARAREMLAKEMERP